MKSTLIKIVASILLLSCMTLIFAMSSQSRGVSNEASAGVSRFIASVIVGNWNELSENEKCDYINSIHNSVRKIAHFTLYAMLAMICYINVSLYSNNSKIVNLFSLAFSMLYSATDEIHQYFVPGRSCELRDVFIDSVGSLFGLFLLNLIVSITVIYKKSRS